MVITWYGEACFKIQSGDVTLKTDPFDKASAGLTTPYFNANVTLLSHATLPDFETYDDAGRNNTSLISSPGEYEMKGMVVRGIQINMGGEGIDTAYVISWGDLKLIHLGFLNTAKINSRLMEACADADIMFVPIGKPYLDAGDAATIVNQLSPKIAIPMCYAVKGLSRKAEDASAFLKELSVSPEQQDKLTIKKKDITEEEHTEIILLNAQASA
ncbi:MAG: MBL fold metallo-hydrolase [Patescibacteria group bacterium]|nr:MBL fold metallo-hydrolase [Patescibacteria group bacterium]MDE2438405.1 MBL fold metallo-hydrolase [Patescibacteria group bacterium]